MYLKRYQTILVLIIISPIIGGLYGILHDQITYTISPEYYTKFKFYQFGLMDNGNEAIFPNPRVEVSAVGFMATWWMGLPIGIILGLLGLTIKDHKLIFKTTIKAFILTTIVTLITGLIGLAYGKFVLADTGVNWWLPDNLIDKKNFIAVGSMHNFSYLGGLLGLIIGAAYRIKSKNSNEPKASM